MDRTTYRGLKDLLWDAARRRAVHDARRILERLNGLPGYRGVNEQRRALHRFARRQFGRSQVLLPTVRRRTRRPVVRVWAAKDDTLPDDPAGDE